jgi:UDP-4-amino-4,6-dideoxy-N-acetyl-beta-L-altrosamine N-acetyltransferase
MVEKTKIRAVEPVDLAPLRAWRSDDRVTRTSLGRRFPTTSVGEETWFNSLGDGQFPTVVVWSVIDDDDQLVGLVRLADIDWIHRTCWFGVWLDPNSWNKGHGLRATRLAIERAFRSFGLRQVRLHVLREHDAARSMYVRVGFADEGVLERAVLIDNEEHDLVQMVLEANKFELVDNSEEVHAR